MLVFVLVILSAGSLFLLFSGSPFFGVFGVLLHAMSHAFLLSLLGLSFFALLTVIVYVGGMLIVFLFSTILSADPSPSFDWKLFFVFFMLVPLVISPWVLGMSWGWGSAESLKSLLFLEGFYSLFSSFGVVTCLVGIILLVALVVVLSLSFEHAKQALRKL